MTSGAESLVEICHHQARACPLCGSTQVTQALTVNSESIIRSNWSYRRLAARDIPSGLLRAWPVAQCSDCEFTYVQTQPTPVELEFVYENLIDGDVARRASWSNESMAARMSFLATFLRMLPERCKVLDYGCGYGPTLALLQTLENVTAYGYDPSQSRRQTLVESRLNVVRMDSEVSSLGLFHGIIVDNVLEHVPNPLDVLRRLHEYCQPEAIVYVSVPDASPKYLNSQRILVAAGAEIDMALNPWEHLNYFNLRSLDSMMDLAGFDPLQQDHLPEDVRVGLRPERRPLRRVRNSLATMIRCIRYAWCGDAVSSPTRRFYRARIHSQSRDPALVAV